MQCTLEQSKHVSSGLNKCQEGPSFWENRKNSAENYGVGETIHRHHRVLGVGMHCPVSLQCES